MLYKDLNLAAIRDKNDLDFAHYTYKPGQCSCCYGPKDLAKKYWKKRTIPDYDDYTYLLFKNADNGSGHVKSTDKIDDGTYIMWDFPEEKLKSVCMDLQDQLGDEYIVLMPKNDRYCILICTTYGDYLKREMERGNYINIKEDGA